MHTEQNTKLTEKLNGSQITDTLLSSALGKDGAANNHKLNWKQRYELIQEIENTLSSHLTPDTKSLLREIRPEFSPPNSDLTQQLALRLLFIDMKGTESELGEALLSELETNDHVNAPFFREAIDRGENLYDAETDHFDTSRMHNSFTVGATFLSRFQKRC
ncbi:hypothetical protein [Ponticaulis profundi]|uniref:Uncharacterized protein n=1 Tax=Ponticaulis profundi TaxID=2665222 RepID=A0ABW1SCY2_9PROT